MTDTYSDTEDESVYNPESSGDVVMMVPMLKVRIDFNRDNLVPLEEEYTADISGNAFTDTVVEIPEEALVSKDTLQNFIEQAVTNLHNTVKELAFDVQSQKQSIFDAKLDKIRTYRQPEIQTSIDKLPEGAKGPIYNWGYYAYAPEPPVKHVATIEEIEAGLDLVWTKEWAATAITGPVTEDWEASQLYLNDIKHVGTGYFPRAFVYLEPVPEDSTGGGDSEGSSGNLGAGGDGSSSDDDNVEDGFSLVVPFRNNLPTVICKGVGFLVKNDEILSSDKVVAKVDDASLLIPVDILDVESRETIESDGVFYIGGT